MSESHAEEHIHRERDYLERTIATVRIHRDAENCWPSWANIFADEIERLWKVEEDLLTEQDALREALENAPLPFAGYQPYADAYYAWYHRGARAEALAALPTPKQQEENDASA